MASLVNATAGKEMTLLSTKGLSKNFAGLTAVDNVSLHVPRGKIHALIGPNGAGKSTLFNLLTSFLKPTSGSISFDGEDITGLQPASVARRGLVRSFQISAVFARMTVEENLRVALQCKLGTAHRFLSPKARLDSLGPRVQELLSEVGLEHAAKFEAGRLSYGERRALELVTSLAMDPVMLLLDEPTQGTGHEDVWRVTDLIRRFSKTCTVLIVEHNMSVVSQLADTISVLERGAVIAEGSYAEVSANPRVIEAYLGRSAGPNGVLAS